MPPSYSHIFIDLDKTIWDFDANALVTFQEMFEKYRMADKGVTHIDTFLEVYTGINDMLWGLYRKNEIKKEVLNIKRFELTLNDFGIDDLILATHMAEDYVRLSPEKTKVYAGVQEVLAEMSKRLPLHLITNGFEEVQQKKIDNCGIRKLFTTITTSEEAGVKKPEPGIFELALSKANAQPDESLMIGDDIKVDIEGARNIGMDQLLFNPTGKKHNGSPTYEADSWDKIKELLC